ncbi:UNVERIFIED_CONTAM: hypothetical protein FKN15_004911 [Acipenser sinensis]
MNGTIILTSNNEDHKFTFTTPTIMAYLKAEHITHLANNVQELEAHIFDTTNFEVTSNSANIITSIKPQKPSSTSHEDNKNPLSTAPTSASALQMTDDDMLDVPLENHSIPALK